MGIGEGYLGFELIAAKPAIEAGALDSQKSLVATDADAHCAPASGGDVTLLNVAVTGRQGLVAVVTDEEFTFDFHNIRRT